VVPFPEMLAQRTTPRLDGRRKQTAEPYGMLSFVRARLQSGRNLLRIRLALALEVLSPFQIDFSASLKAALPTRESQGGPRGQSEEEPCHAAKEMQTDEV